MYYGLRRESSGGVAFRSNSVLVLSLGRRIVRVSIGGSIKFDLPITPSVCQD